MTSTTARGRRRRATPTYDPVAFRDDERSTRQTSVYMAQSSRIRDLYYDVCHDHRDDSWRCNCPATVIECRHIRKAKDYELRRWWIHLLFEEPDDALNRLLAVAEGRGEQATPDDLAMAHACRALLGLGQARGVA